MKIFRDSRKALSSWAALELPTNSGPVRTWGEKESWDVVSKTKPELEHQRPKPLARKGKLWWGVGMVMGGVQYHGEL